MPELKRDTHLPSACLNLFEDECLQPENHQTLALSNMKKHNLKLHPLHDTDSINRKGHKGFLLDYFDDKHFLFAQFSKLKFKQRNVFGC